MAIDVIDECNEDVSFNCQIDSAELNYLPDQFVAFDGLSSKDILLLKEHPVQLSKETTEKIMHSKEPEQKIEQKTEVTFTLAQVQALMGVGLGAAVAVVDSKAQPISYDCPSSNTSAGVSERLQVTEEEPSIDLFIDEVHKFTCPHSSIFIVSLEDSFVILSVKKKYILPPIKNMNTFTEVRFERKFKEVDELHIIEYRPSLTERPTPEIYAEDLIDNINPDNYHVVSKRSSLKFLFNKLIEAE